MRKTVRMKTTIRIILALLIIALIGCKSLVNELAFHPDNINVIPTSKLPSEIEEISIRTKDGIKITALYLPSPESNKVVIYFHGNAGNIYHRIPSLFQLHKLGVNVLGVSYRGYGKSEGKPTEEGIYLDGEAVYQYVIDEMNIPIKNIILFGRSIGSTVAINTAMNRNILGIVLVTPLTSAKEQAEATGLAFISSLAGEAFNNIGKMESIKARLLVIHGTNDNVIPYSMGKKIFEKALGRKKFVKIEGGNHNDLHDKYSREYWVPIIQFIKDV